MVKLYNTIPRLWLILKCLAIGYVIGSIHAPFGFEWRVDSALPFANMGIIDLPVGDMDADVLDDEGIK